MKRIFIFLFIIIFIFSISGCKKQVVNSSSAQSSSEVSSLNSSSSPNSSQASTAQTSSSTKSSATSSKAVVQEKSIFTLYDDAEKKTEALNSLEYDYLEETSMTIDGQESKSTKQGTIKGTHKDGKEIFRAKGSLTAPDESGTIMQYTADFFYNGANYYAISDAGITKEEYKTFSTFFPDVVDDNNSDMPDLKESDITNSVNGTYSDGITFTFKIKASTLKSYLVKQFDDSSITENNLTVSDTEVVGKIDKNGYISSETMTFTMSISLNGKTVSAKLIMKRTTKNPGGNVNVDIPQNLPQ